MGAIYRIMLFGASGQMGQALQHQPLPPDWQLRSYSRAELDITHHFAVRDTIQSYEPDLIINVTGVTSVNKIEHDTDSAISVNFEAPANLAAQCSARDIPLIHLSSDYVFDGNQSAPYQPNDAMNPLSAYGQSKLLGEEAIRHELAWHVILRTSSILSAYGRNILTDTLKMIDESDELRLVTDQLYCPTLATDLADAVIVIAQTLLAGKAGGFGTFHLCGTPACTHNELIEAIMEAYAPYTSRRPKMTPTISAEFMAQARRPSYSVLDCRKILEVYGIKQHSWREGLEKTIQQILSTRRAIS